MSTSALKVGDPLWVERAVDNHPRWDSERDHGGNGTWLRCVISYVGRTEVSVTLPDGDIWTSWRLRIADIDAGWEGGWTTKDPAAPPPEEVDKKYFHEIDLCGEWMVVPDIILEQAIAVGESYVRRNWRSWPYEQELGYTIDPRDNTTFVKFFWKSKEVQK